MKKIKLAAFLMLALGFIACQSSEKPKLAIPVMAYYMPKADGPNVNKLPLDRLSHIIFSFTEVIDNQMQFDDPQQKDQLKKLVSQKALYPHLKVMIACGGWAGSGGFSDMANSAESRKIFVESCIRFLEDYQLDGMDIDWEYPGLKGIGNTHRPEDKSNFTALIQELRQAMKQSGKNYLLTFASAGWDKYYDFIELDKVMPYVDYMNIMTYDNVGGHDSVTFHHTNLGLVEMKDLQGTPAYHYINHSDEPYHPRSAEHIINYCISKGVNPGQIVIGSAFYGKGWIGVEPENNGLYQYNKGGWPGASYGRLKSDYINLNGFVRHWDSIANAPYLFNAQDSVFITYDDPESVALKASYALEHQLGGIMFWQLCNDSEEYDLLEAIYNQVNID